MSAAAPALDEVTRPHAAPIPGVTEAQRARGRKLAMLHQLHVRQLDHVKHVMRQVEEGGGALDDLAGSISGLRMVANYRQFGTLCGQECDILTFHHTSEDTLIFPALRGQADESLRRVIDRLAQEHEVIHQLIEMLADRASDALRDPGPETFAPLKETFMVLDRVARSHFGYEETELEEGLGYFDIPL